MPDVNHRIFRHLLAGFSCLAAVVPLDVFAASDYVGYLEHLGTDATIIAILISNTFLLLGFLVRLQQMRKNLSQKSNALEKSEERIQLMGDNLPNVIFFQLECSPSSGFSFRYLSKGCESVLNIDSNRVTNDAKLAFDHLYEADIPSLQKAYQSARESLESTNLDIRMLDISGNLKWLSISAVPRREKDILVWDGVVQDISNSKKTEEALMEEKRNFQNLFETIDEFLLVCDMNGNLLHTNPAVELHLEYSGEELGEKSLFELYPEHLRAEIYQIIALIQSEQSITCGLPLQKKNGGTVPVEMNLFQGSWKNRKAIFGVARNTTHRRQTETALRESQQMLQLIMDTIPMSIFWKDKDSVYLGCNKAFIQECGFGHIDNVVGKTPHDLFDPKMAATLVARDQQVVSTNQPLFNMLLPYSRPDGTTGQREGSKIPLHSEGGQAVGVLGVWRDVTEQNLAEERLKRTLEDMERFNQLMRGRERRTLELKAEINHLLKELGRQIKYQTTSGDST
ncbi:MAG: PAS domain S-box protein [Verrucomicrobiota bacterium]